MNPSRGEELSLHQRQMGFQSLLSRAQLGLCLPFCVGTFSSVSGSPSGSNSMASTRCREASSSPGTSVSSQLERMPPPSLYGAASVCQDEAEDFPNAISSSARAGPAGTCSWDTASRWEVGPQTEAQRHQAAV